MRDMSQPAPSGVHECASACASSVFVGCGCTCPSFVGCCHAGWGLVVCALSMLMAAWVEHRRLVMFHEGEFHRSTEPDLHHIRVVDMSVFWQIPQVRCLPHCSGNPRAIQDVLICSVSRGRC